MSQILLGDCREVMAGLPPASLDAVVTDPPFGIGFDYGDGRTDVAKDATTYGQWTAVWFGEAMRLLRPGGFFACWQAQLYARYFWDWFGDDIHIVTVCKNFVQMRPTPVVHAYDPVVTFFKDGAAPMVPEDPPCTRDWFVANTAGVVSDRMRLEKGHPCPRTVDAARYLIANFCRNGGTVLDPFMGSGTTGVACAMEGRDFIGIEREPEYMEIARRRIEAAEAQMQLPVA